MDINAIIEASTEGGEPAPEPTEQPIQEQETDDSPEESTEEKPEPEPEPETPKGPAKHSTLRARIKAIGEDFEALKSPEKLEAAKNELLETTRALDKRSHIVEKKERKFEAKRVAFNQDFEQFSAMKQALSDDLAALKSSPDALSAFNAIARLVGRDPVKYYEELSLRIATNGKKQGGAESELQKKLEAIENELKERKQLEEQSRIQQEIEAAKAKLGEVASNADEYPVLAEFLSTRRKDTMSTLIESMEEAYEAGEPITFEQACEQLNEALATALKREPKKLDGTPADKPANGRRPKAQTVGSRLVDSEPRKRPMTDEERLSEMANDRDFMSSLGFSIS